MGNRDLLAGHSSRRILAPIALILALLVPMPAAARQSGRLEPASCPFKTPDGFQATCSFLAVPENRAEPDGHQIRLAVAVLHATGQKAAGDPVLYLAGGPGSPAVQGAAD